MKRLRRFRQTLVGWVYPPVCGACEEPLETSRQVDRPFLCEECESTLEPVGEDYCGVCGQRYHAFVSRLSRCANCGDRELGIDFAVSAYRSSGVARGLMHRFKYEKQRHLSRLMGTLLDEVWRDRRLHRDSWFVVPVPLHPRRMRERGFNQSHEIAGELVRRAPANVNLTLCPALKRVRHTVRQAQLDRHDRLRNLSDAFEIGGRLPKSAKVPAGWLIVDDVVTTGTTVSECAGVLRGALEVEAVAAVSVLRG
ncbi:MAG: ComF family protein [Verrucomicrobiales bacterium]